MSSGDYNHAALSDSDTNLFSRLHWPRTVQLTISVRYSFELLLLLQRQAVPLLEHLFVSIEAGHLDHEMYQRAPQTIPFCEEIIHDLVDVTRLRTLVVRQLALEYVIVFFRRRQFSALERLTLAEIVDHSEFSSPSSIFHLSCACRSRRFDTV